uniref:Uncharacterized protein n=1 Tax=Knipowitschia caucasica TaxID=637954 RepID=A0AAV2MPK1_KNICA
MAPLITEVTVVPHCASVLLQHKGPGQPHSGMFGDRRGPRYKERAVEGRPSESPAPLQDVPAAGPCAD